MSEHALVPNPPGTPATAAAATQAEAEAEAECRPHLPRIRERFSWTVADQAASSGTNALISFGAAHSLSRHEFGSFALAFTLAMVAVGVTRAIASEPLMVSYSGTSDRRWNDAISACMSAALTVAIALGLSCAAVSLLAPDHLSTVVVMLGLVVPGVVLQDTVRFVCFAAGYPREALRCDLTWAAIIVLPAIYLVWTDSSSTQWLAVWGGGATVTALQHIRLIRPQLSLTRATAWWLAHQSLGGPYAAEFLISNGAFQASTIGVGVIAGLSEVGAMRGAGILLGPFGIVITGAIYSAMPHAVDLRNRHPEALDRFVLGVSVGLALVMSLGATVLLVPDLLGHQLLGDTWAGTRQVLLPAILGQIVAGIATGAVIGLRALTAARSSLRIHAISAFGGILASLLGAALAGARGATLGIATVQAVMIPVWWRTYSALRSRIRTTPEAHLVATNDLGSQAKRSNQIRELGK